MNALPFARIACKTVPLGSVSFRGPLIAEALLPLVSPLEITKAT